MSWMLSWEVIFCASHSFSHLKRKIVDHGNYTWELVKDWNAVSEVTPVTFCAVLNSWTLVRGEDNRLGEEIVWWWQSLLALPGETSSGREELLVKDLQGLLFLKEFLKEKWKRVENEAGGGWAESVPLRSQSRAVVSRWRWLCSQLAAGSLQQVSWAGEAALLEQMSLLLPAAWHLCKVTEQGTAVCLPAVTSGARHLFVHEYREMLFHGKEEMAFWKSLFNYPCN